MEDLLAAALTASLLAGDAILEVYRTDFEVSLKKDRSPLTEADRRAHGILTGRLASSGLPILSEEGRDIPYQERQAWDLFWLVDPLDGTKEFVKRNGEFSVNVALIRAEMPVIGVVYLPVRREVYFSTREHGAYQFSDCDAAEMSGLPAAGGSAKMLRKVYAGAVRLGAIPSKSGSLPVRLLRSRSHRLPAEERFIAGLRRHFPKVETAAAGSAAKFCIIARGDADVYLRFGNTGEWDTAAGQCLLEEVGGEVLDMETRFPLTYNKRSLKNSSFLAIGPRFKPGSAERNALFQVLFLDREV